MKEKKYSIFIICFIFLYSLNGMITGFLGKEIFPLFSWNLFSYIPNDKISEYAIILDIYNGGAVFPPQLFQEAKEISRESNSITAYYLIQDFGRAYEKRERGEAERLQKLFEANFIKAPAKYRLIRIISNPLERWKTGKYEILSNIQEFIVGEHEL